MSHDREFSGRLPFVASLERVFHEVLNRLFLSECGRWEGGVQWPGDKQFKRGWWLSLDAS